MRVLLPALAAGAAARPAAAHRVAVLVSGTRPFTNATWDSLKTHVLDALEARGTAYEAFACGEPGQAVPPFATEVAASHATPEARLAACYAAAVGKAQSPRRWGPPRASAPFTHFLKTRPDHLWHAPPPLLSRLPAARVALRARVLVGHVRVSSDAMSWHGCGLRDGDLRPLCEDGPASLKPDGANACLVLDDQVALVPACAADAFFFGGRGTPRRAHECETQPEGASDLRLTWNEKTSVSFPRPFVTLGVGVLVDVFSVAVAEPAEPTAEPVLSNLAALLATPDSRVDLRTGVGRRARRRVAEVSETKLLGRRARDDADEALRPAAPPPRHRGVPRAPDRGQAQPRGLPRARALLFLQRERRGISLGSFVIIFACLRARPPSRHDRSGGYI